MNTLAVIIVVLVLLYHAVDGLADYLNVSAVSPVVPPDFADVYDPERYAESQAYLKTTTGFNRLISTVSLFIFLGFWFWGGFGLLDRWVRSFDFSPVVSGLLYIGVLSAAGGVPGLVASWYRTFVIEERFGFNRTTARLFWIDRLKALGLVLLLGTPLLAAVLAIFEYGGHSAWLWCWLVLTVFMLVLQVVVPAWIMPLFNRFTPLPEGELRTAVMEYAAASGMPLENIFVMDGSRRSAKSNAFFAGLGSKKRLVLFDTLINNHSPDEIVAVVAHETGHYRKKHILLSTVLSVLQAGVMLYLLSLFISSQILFDAFYVSQPSVYVGLVLFSLLFAPIDWLVSIGMQMISRHHERVADRFAAESTGRPQALANALKRLSVDNLSNLTPHSLYVFLNYSHPPVAERVRSLKLNT